MVFFFFQRHSKNEFDGISIVHGERRKRREKTLTTTMMTTKRFAFIRALIYLPRRTPSLGKSRRPKSTASLGKSRLPKRMASLGKSRLPNRTGS